MEIQKPQQKKHITRENGYIYTIQNSERGINYRFCTCEQETPRGKKPTKLLWSYTYPTLLAAKYAIAKHIAKVVKQQKDRAAEKHKKATQLKKARAQFIIKPSIVTGDIFEETWGFEHTTVEFFQVVKVMGISVKLMAIAKEIVRSNAKEISGRVVPVKDKFIGNKVYVKKVQFYKGEPYFEGISEPLGAIYKYSSGAKGSYFNKRS